jgi:hypothetical protein
MLTAGIVPDEDEFDLMPDPDSAAAKAGAAPSRPAAAPVKETFRHAWAHFNFERIHALSTLALKESIKPPFLKNTLRYNVSSLSGSLSLSLALFLYFLWGCRRALRERRRPRQPTISKQACRKARLTAPFWTRAWQP